MSIEGFVHINGPFYGHNPDSPDVVVNIDELAVEIAELKARRDELNAEKLDVSTGKNEKEEFAFRLYNDQFDTSELDRQITEKEALYNHLVNL